MVSTDKHGVVSDVPAAHVRLTYYPQGWKDQQVSGDDVDHLPGWYATPLTPKLEDASAVATAREGIQQRVRAMWRRHRADLMWLVGYAVLNVVAFAWRFKCFAKDPVVGYWPSLAKGSAELVLINCVLALLSVCYRLVGRVRVVVTRIPLAAMTSFHSPVEKHIAFHKIAGSVVILASLTHSVAWILIVILIRGCSLDEWKTSAYHHLPVLRDASPTSLLGALPMWTGLVMLVCVLIALPFCLPCARVRCFNTFAVAHLVFIPFLVLLLVHARLVLGRAVLEKQLPAVYLDGPMGTSTQFYERYEALVFLSTGIGVTPFLSLLRHVLHTWRRATVTTTGGRGESASRVQKIVFVWSTREIERFQWLMSTLVEFQDVLSHPMYANALHFSLHLTATDSAPDKFLAPPVPQEVDAKTPHPLPACIQLRFSRPDWPQLLGEAATQCCADSDCPPAIFICAARHVTKQLKEILAAQAGNSAGHHVYAEAF
ncbi:hypothetical protein BBJ28_00009340 [Nothophytophthora sp. Chile5]|nr:hypothetical protein BBJ28_00009340 [Nothophytophthora sp. Chile5]